jgi:Flp pilus assembly protein TadD
MRARPATAICVVTALALALAGCGATGSHSSYAAAGKRQQSWFTAARSDPLEEAKTSFRNNNYGLAERSFREAVEASPKNAEAWLGLAASYDQLGRFDLADRAYEELIKLKGPLPQILNNRGYSYYLRGDVAKARSLIAEAAAAQPDDPRIRGNLELLQRSSG